MVTKSFENRLWIQHHFHFLWYFTSTNRRTKKDASAVPYSFLVPLNFINFIADRHSSSSNKIHCSNQWNFIRTKFVQKNRFSEVSLINFYKDYYGNLRIIEKNPFPCTNFHEDTSISVSSSYFFTFIPLFVSFFLFFFLILLYRCRARARKKMKNARFLLHSVCDRFLFRTSNVPLSFFLYNNQNTRGTMIVVSLYHVHAYTVY